MAEAPAAAAAAAEDQPVPPRLPRSPPPSFDEFKSLPSERQSEEVFKLLSLLSPFASQVHTADIETIIIVK